jgi:hypothetical protein
MRVFRLSHVALGGVALCLSACGTLYKLDVSAHNNTDKEFGNTYIIASGDADLNVYSPEFNTYADQLERALSGYGYRRLPEQEMSDADMALYIRADIDDPTQRVYEANRPVYETQHSQDSVRSSRSSGNSGGSAVQQKAASMAAAQETAPPEALIGNEEVPFSRTVYTKYLNVTAIDFQAYLQDLKTVGREKAVRREIWSVDVSTTGSPSDMGEVMPVMITAAKPYFGSDTDGEIRVSMSETNRDVLAIKNTN